MKPLHRNNVSSVSRPPVFLQFGSGNFLRAFLDWMIQCWNDQTDFSGSIIVLKSSPYPSRAFDQLVEQEGLYHLLTRGQQQEKLIDAHQLIDVVERVEHPWEHPDDYLALAEIPSLRFVLSNTTEAGIIFEPGDQFSDRPARTFPGKLTQLLYRRYTHFGGAEDRGFVFLPCELIPKNGEELQNCIIQYAQHWKLGKAFISWIRRANTFCNTLVDRIVPGFPHKEELMLQKRTGFQDELIVVAEPYHLLVIDAPPTIAQMLPWPELGLNVIFTDQLNNYQRQKVRILNGAHTAMVALGLVQDIQTVKGVMEDSSLPNMLLEMIHQEIIPGIELPKEQLEAYATTIFERFQNPFIEHRLVDIALNSITKFRTRLLPSLLSYQITHGYPPSRIVQTMAALAYLYRGDLIPLKDDPAHISFFESQWLLWEKSGNTAALCETILGYQAGWGIDLNQYTGLADALNTAMEKVIAQLIRP
jgi:tagaturonate reductase